MAVGPFGHPFLGELFAAPAAARAFEAGAVLERMLAFERALNAALLAAGLIDATAARTVDAALCEAAPAPDVLAAATARDGVPVPALIARLRQGLSGRAAEALHAGATSQDVIDTALAMTLKPLNEGFSARLDGLAAALAKLEGRFGSVEIAGVTRMQRALPIAAAHRFRGWAAPLAGLCRDLDRLRPRIEALQLGGPVGDRRGFGTQAAGVAQHMADALGLSEPGHAWHADRSALAAYAGWLAGVCGALGKIGQDIAMMALAGEIALAGAGGSSAMAHKANPVGAELLVTLARFSATLSGGMQQAVVHEQERSGAAWTLEWMLLPQMIAATDCACDRAAALLDDIRRVGPA